MDLAEIRREYASRGLRRHDLDADPCAQFARWFEEAQRAVVLEVNAMSLATVNQQGQPSQRTVLLKYFDSDGFVFFTNLQSRKAAQIAVNTEVSLLFFWRELERQVAVEGTAERVSARESLAYFVRRPRGSRIGAWVSQQSSIIGSRQLLEAKFEEMRRKFEEGEVPLPSFWGGFRVRPRRFEYWQGRPNRLHDRFQYRREDDQGWLIERLAP
jgi:pyridoxamine 5'-phosphate oxidase